MGDQKMKINNLLVSGWTAGCLLLAAVSAIPTTAEAESHEAPAPSYINFRIQTVKQDSGAEWEKLRKERRDAAKAAGHSYYHVYERLRGPGQGFLIVSAEQGIGDPPADIEMAGPVSVPESWYSAISRTLDSQLVLSLRYYPNLRTNTDGPAHPPEKFMHLRIRTAAPGKSGEFESWLRDDLIPELRRAGAGDVRNARVVLGGSPRTWVTASFVSGWPYDPGNVPVNQAMLEKGDALVASRNDYFYAFREDLSFTVE